MYYLLENNRIIDSEISYTTNFPYWEVKDNRLYAKSKNNKIVRPYNENEIKKQSENVYDLIDWDKDLVRIAWSDKRSFIIDCTINKSDFNDEYYSLEWINAIYKQDANGNYIKVWEAKDEKN